LSNIVTQVKSEAKVWIRKVKEFLKSKNFESTQEMKRAVADRTGSLSAVAEEASPQIDVRLFYVRAKRLFDRWLVRNGSIRISLSLRTALMRAIIPTDL
jgi:hypothetical protein